MSKLIILIWIYISTSYNLQCAGRLYGYSSKISILDKTQIDKLSGNNLNNKLMGYQKEYKINKSFDINTFERNQKNGIYEFADNYGMTVKQEKTTMI